MSAAVLHRPSGAFVRIGHPRCESRRDQDAARSAALLAPRLTGPTCIVVSCISLQTAAALATTVFATFGPAGTGALRFFAGAAVLLVAVRPRLRGRTTRAWLVIAALGAAMAATNLFVYEAIARVPLGMAGTLVFLGPFALALISSRRRSDVAWGLAAAAGVILLTGGAGGASIAGVAFGMAAAACVAASIIAARRVGEHAAGLEGLALSVVVAALLTAPVGLPAALAAPSLHGLTILAIVGGLGIAVPYGLEFTALRDVGVKTYGILLSLDPAIAGLIGFVLLGQQLTAVELIGIGLVISASAGATASQSATRRA